MDTLRPGVFAFLAFAVISSSICRAQLYETPESRRRQVEAQRQAEEQKQKDAAAARDKRPSLEQKEAEAKEYIDKTFWYIPNRLARDRLSFYEKMPQISFSTDPKIIFHPLTITTFVVTGIVMPPPVIAPAGTDNFLLEIRFPDGKFGYVNIHGCCGILQNLYVGEKLHDYKEYVSVEPAEQVFAKDKALRETLAREAAVANENVEREERAKREKAEKEENTKQSERKRLEDTKQRERKRQEALPLPHIGMTQAQVVNQSRWGKPHDINRTTYASGTREQWVYGNRRYLYFVNGILTAIQD